MKLSKLRLRGTNKARRWRGSLHSLASLSLNRRWLMDAFMQHHWPLAKNKVTESLGLSVCFFPLLDLVLSRTLALFGTLEPQFVNVRLTDGQVGEVGQVGHTAERQDSCERTKIFFFPLCRPTLSTSVCRSESWNCLSPSVYLFFFLSCFNLLKKCHTSQRRHLVLLLWWFTVGVSGALLGGTPAADLRFSHLQTDVC